jgi:parvulin-like peptidyl-prolyl isomerase
MKSLGLSLLLCAGAGLSQTAPPAPAAPPPAERGDTVIGVFEDGGKITLDELRVLIPALPQQFQQMAVQDRQRFLHYYAMMRKLSQMAEHEKLDQRSPYKEVLVYSRLSTLTDIKLKDVLDSMTVAPEEVEKYYKEHQEPYKAVKVSAIYIAFGDAEAASSLASSPSSASRITKKTLTEEEAKAKAAKLLAEARAGADFKALVRENSDDETSRDKSGDFGTWRMSDNVPDLMRPVVFGLKQGELGEPVRQAHGYYIFRADEVTYAPLSQVHDSIFQQLKQQRFQEWTQKLDTGTKVEFPKPETAAPAPAGGK